MSTASQLRHRPADVKIPTFGIYIVESHHARTFQMEMGTWQYEKVCWVTLGKGKLAMTAEGIAINKDDLLLIPAGVAHRFVDDPTDPLTLVVVCFERVKLLGANALPRLLDKTTRAEPIGGPLRGSNSRIQNDINDAFRRMLREQSAGKMGYEVVLQAELANLLVRIIRGCEESPKVVDENAELISDVLQYLDEYYYKPIQLGELAKYYNISIRRFSDLFKKRTGRTLIDYLNSKRIEAAKERLRATGHITYACLESGFNDLGYFYRVFRKYTGQTPGEFIRCSSADDEALDSDAVGSRN